MTYEISEITIGDLGFTFRCDCGFKYVWFRHEEGCRDWHAPETSATLECFKCGEDLKSVWVRRNHP